VTHPAIRLVALTVGLALAAAAGAQSTPAAADTTSDGDPRWIEGYGENEIVLIHGLGASNRIWQDITPFMAGSFRLFKYELHGHGETQPLANPSIEAEAAALAAWIDEQGIVYPTLVGHGLGGMIAMQYTFEHPARVQRLVVIDAGPRQQADAEQKAQVAQALLEDYDRFVASRFISISPSEEINELAVDLALRTDSATFAALLLSSFDWDLTAELHRQSVPMLVIGTQAYLPEEGNERAWLEEYGYGAARVLSFKRMALTGHYAMLERPTYLASVIMVYIRQEEIENFSNE
jgi:pimeloyl-ACP methyl ester carboxylesterase